MTTASENPQETKKQRSCPEIGFRVRPFASIGKHLRQCLFVLLLLATAVLAQPKASAVTLPTSVPTANATWVLEDMANLFMRSGDSDSVTSPTVYKLYCFMPDVSGSYSILVMPTGSLNPIFRVYDSSGYYITSVIDASGSGYNEYTSVTLTAGQWYFVAVGGYSTSLGGYMLGIQGPSLSADNIPTYLPDNTGSTSGSINWGGDMDFFKATAPSYATTMTVTVTPTSYLAPFFEIYDAGENFLDSGGSYYNGSAGTATVSVSGGA